MSDSHTVTETSFIDLSVVIPVYGCADCLRVLHERLTRVLDGMQVRYEIVYVDDRSRDDCWSIICELARTCPSIRAVRLSRNFGQHVAITAGLSECCGQAAVVMDCDLQDPPEVIPEFWRACSEGCDVVVGSRQMRSHSIGRRSFAHGYTLMMRFLGRPKYDSSIGSFSLISRKVITEFLKFRDVNRHYLFILDWLGFERTVVPFVQSERLCGQSSYSFYGLLKHAVQGILFQTTDFLKWVVALGATAAVTGFAATLYIIILYLFRGALPGWTSLAVSLWTIGGLILSTLGIVGLYVGQVFDQVKDRPLFVIDTRITGRHPEQASSGPLHSEADLSESDRTAADRIPVENRYPR